MSKSDFGKTTRELIERAQREVSEWEKKADALEDGDDAKAHEAAARRLESWESILECLFEIEELLEDLKA